MEGCPLIGRDAELLRVSDLLTEVSREGQTLVLRGEAGIGKSALLGAAVSRATELGMTVLVAAGVQAETRVTYAGVHQLLGPVLNRDGPAAAGARAAVLGAVGAVGAADLPDDEPFTVALAVLDVLSTQAQQASVLLVVDDAQWVDPASWEVLLFVVRRLRSEPVGVLIGMRDGAEADERLDRAHLPVLPVGPLEEPAARQLLDRCGAELPTALRARILTEASGNPLGLVELAAAAAAVGEGALLPAWLPLTTRLEQTFAAAVSRLPTATRALLLIAALDDAGRLGELVAAASILEGEAVTDADLKPAVSAGVVDITDGLTVRFRHPLIRSAVRQATGVARRQRAHAALARVLAGEADRSIWHRAAAAAGPDERVAAALAATAARARERLSYRTAIEGYQRAAELSADPARKASRLMRGAEAAIELGDPPAAVRLLEGLIEEDLSARERTHLSWLREIYLDVGWSGAARLPAFVALSEQMRRDGDPEAALAMLDGPALRAYWSNPAAEVRRLIVASVDRLSLAPTDPRRVWILAMVEPVDRGGEILDRLPELLAHLDTNPVDLFKLGFAAAAVGDYDASRVFFAVAVVALRRRGYVSGLTQALAGQAWTAAIEGDTRLGLSAATEAGELATELAQPVWRLSADLARGVVEALRGHGDTARALADQAEAILLPLGAYPMLSMVQFVRGVDALAGGRAAEAFDQLHRMFDRGDVSYHPYLRLRALGHLAQAAADCQRLDDLRRVVAEIEEIAAVSRAPVLRVGLVYAGALLAPPEQAEKAFLASLQEDLASWPFDRARLSLAYGEWLRRQRRPLESRPLLRAALSIFEALGTHPWADRARHELRVAGEVVHRADDLTGDLTPQERQIAHLAAQGLTNPQIAATLFLSPRTVSTHLSNLYRKLGVTSRRDLAALFSVRRPAAGTRTGAAGSDLRHLTYGLLEGPVPSVDPVSRSTRSR